MNKQGVIKAICTGAEKGERKTPVDAAIFIEGHGIENDIHAGAWHRQVSILAVEDVDAMKAEIPELKPGDFAENITVSGVDLSALGLGSRIRLGVDVEISITQIGKECHDRCRIYDLAGDCIMPRMGLFARVIKGGTVKVGDEAVVVDKIPRDVFQCVVLTASDRCSRGESRDTAGPAVAALLESGIGANIYGQEILGDEQELIEARMKHYSSGHSIDMICVVGGTGFAPRDVTPEAVAGVIERSTPGLDEAMRSASMLKTPYAMLSRAVSGICGSTLIISFPGSERAAVENLEAVLPALAHGLKKLRGDPSDCGRSLNGGQVH